MTKRKFNIRLPRKMAALLRMALANFNKTEKTPGYEICMGSWHTPWETIGGKHMCSVCLAGAILAQRQFPKCRRYHSDYVSANLHRKLSAINALRVGDIHLAAFYLNRKNPGMPSVNITPYEEDPKAFKRDLRHLAIRLEKNGL